MIPDPVAQQADGHTRAALRHTGQDRQLPGGSLPDLRRAPGAHAAGRELYLTEGWTKDPTRLQAVGLASDTPFATKPQLARHMLERARAAGVPMAWVTGDTVYGHSRALRSWLEDGGRHHMLAVPRNEEL